MVYPAPQVAEAKTPQQVDVGGESLLYAESMVRTLVYCQPAKVTRHAAGIILHYCGYGELDHEYRKT